MTNQQEPEAQRWELVPVDENDHSYGWNIFAGNSRRVETRLIACVHPEEREQAEQWVDDHNARLARDAAPSEQKRFGLAVCKACGADFYPQWEEQQVCDDCNGRGWQSRQVSDTDAEQVPCPTCGGAGKWEVQPTDTPALVVVRPPFPDTQPVGLDAEIAEAVQALWSVGVWTIGSCSGHGSARPSVVLAHAMDGPKAHEVLDQDGRDWEVLAWTLTFV